MTPKEDGVEPTSTLTRRELRVASPADVLREHRNAMTARNLRSRHTQTRARAEFQLRARADGTGGTAYTFEGYAAVFEAPFEMWDWWGDEYYEVLAEGSCNRTLANQADVQFLIGHNEAGMPLARTKSGTMTLSADSHGLAVYVPALDGRSPTVQALASAVERGDMDEMSIGFIAVQQQWSPDYSERRITEINLNRGDVSPVCWGANPATAGSSMVALPTSGSTARLAEPAREARADATMDTTDKPAHDASEHGPGSLVCPNSDCARANGPDAAYCDQCGQPLYDEGGLITAETGAADEAVTDDGDGVIEVVDMDLARARVRMLALRG